MSRSLIILEDIINRGMSYLSLLLLTVAVTLITGIAYLAFFTLLPLVAHPWTPFYAFNIVFGMHCSNYLEEYRNNKNLRFLPIFFI